MPLPNRRSVRLPHFDYGAGGCYFLTVCTRDRQHLFGEIQNGIICLNDLGALVWAEYQKSFAMRPHFTNDAFVVMPNHWHALVGITRIWTVGDETSPRVEAFGKPIGDSVTGILRGMLSAITGKARRAGLADDIWQGRFWDHVVRDEKEYWTIFEYIVNNTRRWTDDRFFGEGV